MTVLFSYSTDDCDVVDKDKLIRYRELAEHWYVLLHGDAEQSVSGQISDMMWQDAAWRLANEARRFTFDDGPTAAVSPILGKLLDRGYISGQIIAISRLIEKHEPRHPKKGVVSLRRIVDELDANREVFTREIFVSNNGLPYDWEEARRKHSQNAAPSSSIQFMESVGPAAFYMAMGKHEQFDLLAGSQVGDRQRSDRIADAVFDRLKQKLNDPVFNEVLKLRHKRVAHAADAYSRDQVDNLRKGLKLEEFAKAHYVLTGVLQALSQGLLFGFRVGTSVPTTQPEEFEYLNVPFVQATRMRDIGRFWSEHCNARETWLSDAYFDTLPELSPP